MTNIKSLVAKARARYVEFGQKFGAFQYAPSRGQAQIALFAVGVTLLSVGLIANATAQGTIDGAEFNDERISNSVNMLLTYMEGSFGALIMVAAGLGAILSSAFGQYRAALGCLVVAVGAFILRSVLGTFFNSSTIQE